MKISVKEYLLRSLRECDESDSMLLELLRAYRDLKNNQPERSKREDVELFCPIDGRVLDTEKTPFHKNTRYCHDCGEYRAGIQ